MSKLDCENISTLYKSIENISGIKRKKLSSILEKFDLDKFYTENPTFSSGKDVFLHLLQKNAKYINHNSTSWFHLTRARSENEFTNGLLPLHKSLNTIWEFLYELACPVINNTEWLRFREITETGENESDGALMYRIKKNKNNNQYGPYGFLAMNISCFDKPLSELHYLKDGAEIIYHICDAFKEYKNYNLFNKYLAATKPCIVKFVWMEPVLKDVGSALCLLHGKLTNMQLSYDSNPCFSTRGRTVPKENIEKIIIIHN